MVKKAVILAAGGGGRTRPFTANRPKSMLYIAGKPLLQITMENLKKNGIRDIILVVGHHKECIFDYFASGINVDLNITYATQPLQLGSADALMKAQELVRGEFLVIPGNKYISVESIDSILDSTASSMLVKNVINPPRTSMVNVQEGLVINDIFEERRAIPYCGNRGNFLVDTRTYLFDMSIFQYLENVPSISAAVNKMIDAGRKINAVEARGEWADLIYPWDILNVNEIAMKNVRTQTAGIISSYVSILGECTIGESCKIGPFSSITGPVIISSNCKLGANVCIEGPVCIGADTNIEPYTYISNSIIGSNVDIGVGAIIKDSIIDNGNIIGSRFTAITGDADIIINNEHHHKHIGTMIGEGCQIGSGVTTRPGTILGNFCKTEDLKVLSGTIPDKGIVL